MGEDSMEWGIFKGSCGAICGRNGQAARVTFRLGEGHADAGDAGGVAEDEGFGGFEAGGGVVGFEEDLAGVVGEFDGAEEVGGGEGGLEGFGVVEDAAEGEHDAALAEGCGGVGLLEERGCGTGADRSVRAPFGSRSRNGQAARFTFAGGGGVG